MTRSLRLWPLLLLLAACARTPRPSADLANKYHDATIRQIGTAQDERNTAALLPFLTNANPTYRREAALAFASVQAPAAVPGLIPLLRDADLSVRRAAAYALGQTGDSTAVDSLRGRLLKETDNAVRRYEHEALGRTVTRSSLPELWRVEALTDTARASALALGLSRAALRGLISPESIRRTVLVLNSPRLPERARLVAMVGLSRTRGYDADLARLAQETLLRVAQKDRSYAVRAAAATTLGKLAAIPAAPATASTVATPAAAGTVAAPATSGGVTPAGVLARLATKDPDYRVRLSAIRALPFDAETYSASRKAVFYALSHDRAPVALTAAEWLLAHAKGESGPALAALADGNKQASPRVRAALLQAAVRHASPAARPSLIETIQKRYAAAPTVYEKSFLLQALAEDPASFDLLKAEAFAAGQAPVVAGNALGALLTMRRQAEFPAARHADFAAAMRQALASGDVAQLGTAAEALTDAKLYPQAQPDDLAALRQAQAKLQLPREIEAWQGLQQALDKLEKAPKPTPTPVATAQQHPIDWAVVQGVPLGQQVRLRTSKGIILLELKPNEAPGAVASFVTLIGQHFYDNLYFHRVVPNFVAQGGDPRGDGNGSAPYNLRSEFGDLHYEEGSVGLASAGKDTESCQFFITHTPTPHLDGRYPIFAQVVGGMDVVHKLEIGDQILGIELVK
ncbi:peptidylprolyl isomerase [Hymenobacter sp. BT770]|uniref:peptidylprolyl isomerase n=1 Tax=Hymenobacter sp. BT770 TaxID=2886942 RepID=UPI001D123E00|nr:peptidylprolyl isomerase [Hymenobacter sp. BT770]MCC3153834.1 peptidylprolyl isomerase [Hymenobacter sp. BT770]MDO3415978.1 peptidylprolyl isomerase [Hymenobacter sp. BT770]